MSIFIGRKNPGDKLSHEDEGFDTSDLDKYVKELIQDGDVHTMLWTWSQENQVHFDLAHQLWKAGVLELFDTLSGKQLILADGITLDEAISAVRVYNSVVDVRNVDPIAEARVRNERTMQNAWNMDEDDRMGTTRFGPKLRGPRRRW